jgi:predicted RNase H-like HicB family nuclease
MKPHEFTAIITREDGGYVALCPELDVTSQGDTPETAAANLKEALELFLESAPSDEVAGRLEKNGLEKKRFQR